MVCSNLKGVRLQGEEGEDRSERQGVGLGWEDSEHIRGQGDGSASRELVFILQKKYEALKQAAVAASNEANRKHDEMKEEVGFHLGYLTLLSYILTFFTYVI